MTQRKTADVQAALKERLDYDEIMNCVQCGFCLPSCPTYTQTKNEAASPRGRIALMKGVADGWIEPDEDVEQQLKLCLGCRACEPACPSGVRYGHLLEEALDVLESHKTHSRPVRFLRWFFFRKIFPRRRNMRLLVALVWVYQKSGLRKLIRALGLFNVFPKTMAQMEQVLPKVPSLSTMKRRPDRVAAKGETKRQTAFFSGCMMDTVFMGTNDATLRLLSKAGCDVWIPEKQQCCGALHAHSGEKDAAKAMAKQNIEAFEEQAAETIVCNAGGCGAILKEYDHLLRDEPEWRERARRFSERVKDISDVLVEQDFQDRDLSLPRQIVAYQESCHLRNVMRTADAPRRLLQSVKGVEFRELKDPEQCCGSAGIYNLVQGDMSMQILNDKMSKVKAVEPSTVVTGNPGCLLQMRLGIHREDAADRIEAVHLADLLDRASGS